jgi:alanyl-tRNA synthetase
MIQENKELNRRVRALEEVTAGVEAQELLAGARIRDDGTRVIAKTFDSKDADGLKKIAHSLIANPQVIALLGSREDDTARLVFARSADVADDMNSLMRNACALLDGKGGGKPDMAQGGGKNVEKLDESIRIAAES